GRRRRTTGSRSSPADGPAQGRPAPARAPRPAAARTRRAAPRLPRRARSGLRRVRRGRTHSRSGRPSTRPPRSSLSCGLIIVLSDTLADRIAIVTGAGSGMGAATARLLSSKGLTIALVGRRADALEAVAGELEGTAT